VTVLKTQIMESTIKAFGQEMYDLMKRLYPICRSITGKGVVETLDILKERIPLKIEKVPTETEAFDWSVPQEWNIRDAYIKNSQGEKIVDFKKHNVHVVSYSEPVDQEMTLAELSKHLHSLPDLPEAVPYLTSYYKRSWGFCLSHLQLRLLPEDKYKVFIDSSLNDGYLHYGEYYKKGRSNREMLISCYICHPSMCNDSLSGVVLALKLAEYLESQTTKFSYRVIFIPETIGAICWLAKNESHLKNIFSGLVVTCCGDSGSLTYKKSRQGNALIDRIVLKVLEQSNQPYNVLDFFPSGSDERQFCSPGFDLPIGSLMRTPYAKFKEYHTSLDNLEFVQPQYLEDTFDKYVQTINHLENARFFLNRNPKCEPQLGKRGLYSQLGGLRTKVFEKNLRWVLNYSDGKHSLEDIADLSMMAYDDIEQCAEILKDQKLLEEIGV
jgi:aminopeptidase-like protein